MKDWINENKRLIVIAFGIILCLVIGVPVIINELYKIGKGYITLWSAVDVLSYYGTIVAALIGIVGVYLTVYISNKNYRDDARNRILPFIAITVINIKQPDPFLKGLGTDTYDDMKNNPIIMDSLSGKTQNHLYFVIDGKAKIRVAESLTDMEAKKIEHTEVIWRRAKDGRMYLRDADVVSMPFIIENIGNGAAKNLCIGLSYSDSKPFYKTEITLKQNEKFFLHIFSEKAFEIIKGNYTIHIHYEDISGNEYEQLFPVNIMEQENHRYKNIDTNGKQHLIRRKR